MAYFWITFSVVALPALLVDRHQFQSLSSLDAYIDTLEHGKEQFVTKQQEMKFYVEYAGVIAKQSSEFARKVKEKRS